MSIGDVFSNWFNQEGQERIAQHKYDPAKYANASDARVAREVETQDKFISDPYLAWGHDPDHDAPLPDSYLKEWIARGVGSNKNFSYRVKTTPYQPYGTEHDRQVKAFWDDFTQWKATEEARLLRHQ